MMTKIKLLLLSLFAVEAYAQSPMTISTDFTVDYGNRRKGEQVLFEPDNYNIDETEITGVWTAGTTEDKATYKVIANPAQGGINTSAKCLEVTCRNNDGSIGIDFSKLVLLHELPNLNGRRRISMLFKAGKNNKTQTPLGNGYYTQLQLETNYEGDGKQVYCLGAYYDAIENSEAGHDGWKRLYFDFTPYNSTDNKYAPGYHTKVIGDYPSQLVFKPKICKATIASDKKITSHERHTCSDGDVYYIDEIKIEDVPYAEGYWIEDNTNLPKGTFNADATPKWNTTNCALPLSESNGVLHLSGTWLKGQNIVNPEIWENKDEGPWVYEFNEYRDLSWHVKPGDVKLMVFHKDAKLRWPDRGGLLGTNTGTPEAAVERFIDNLNVLIFAEKSCILPDEVDNLAAHWHDTNAVIHYSNDDSWKAWELELTEKYPFLNPQEFTVESKIKVHRTMKEGFNALIYPFSLTAAELCCSRVGTVYHHKDSQKLYFVPKTQTEPNVPYIIEGFTPTFVEGTTNVGLEYQEFSKDDTKPGGRTVSTVDSDYAYSSEGADGVTFKGNYKEISGKDMWGLVTKSDWQGFMRGGEKSKFMPFRGYIEGLSLQAGAIRLFMTDDEITGIDSVESVTTTDNCWYSLDGRMLTDKPAKSGIYIKNGKKVIIK